MTNDNQKYFDKLYSLLIPITFIISTIYLIYIALTSQMIIFHDSIGYEWLGKLINEKGFTEFLITGPQREPLYPLLVALSMKLGELFRLSYQDVLKFLQVIILIVTQILALRVANILKFSTISKIFIILYIGFSPKIVNSAMICYSEIAAYPWILAIVISSAYCWINLKNQKEKPLILWSFLLGLSFVSATLTKAIFLIIFPIFILPIGFHLFQFFISKNKTSFRLTFLFLLIVTLTYNIPITAYKYTNKQFNGQFTISDNRGSWALYGSTAKRVEPKKSHQLSAAIVYSIGSEICNNYFSLDECLYWTSARSDYLGMNKSFELEKTHITAEEINKNLIKLSFKEILKDPAQYFLLTGIEYIKVFFWDFRDIAYVVALPSTIEDIYNFAPARYTLYFLIALLTLGSLIYLINFCRRNISTLSQLSCDLKTFLLWQSLMLIALYTAFSSLFYIDPRHILPLGPLYILIIIWMMQSICHKCAPSQPN